MSEWYSKPRVTPMAGHRKATAWYCNDCLEWHGTHRALNPEACAEARRARTNPPSEFPHIRQIPQSARN